MQAFTVQDLKVIVDRAHARADVASNFNVAAGERLILLRQAADEAKRRVELARSEAARGVAALRDRRAAARRRSRRPTA